MFQAPDATKPTERRRNGGSFPKYFCRRRL